MDRKKLWWKRRSGPVSVLFWALGLLWGLAKWVGLAGLPDDANTLYRWANAIIDMVPSAAYWMILGSVLTLGLVSSAIYVSEKWDSIRSKVLSLPWAWRYVRITAIGKVSVHYRFVARQGTRVRQPSAITRIKKGQTVDIKFDIPEGVHTFHLIIEVPPIYKLLFPHSRSDVEWVETIASNGRRRYKSTFVTHRRTSSQWVRVMAVNRYGEGGWCGVRNALRERPSVQLLALRGRAVGTIASPPPTFEELLALAQGQERGKGDPVPPGAR